MKILNDADYAYRTSSNKQLLVEVALIRLCQLLKPATPPFDQAEELPSLRNPLETPRRDVNDIPPKPANQPQVTEEPQPQYSPVQPKATAPEPRHEHKPLPKGRPRAFRLSDQPEETPVYTLEKRETPFSEQDFERAWEAFMANHSDMHILLSTMRVARREKKSDTCYSLMVEHPAQLQAFESSMQKLVTFLRDYLKNDHLTLETHIDEKSEILKPLPPQEFLKKIITENPALGEFLQSIDAEMA